MLKFYGYAKCGTCRKARKWLDERGIDYEFIDITQTPPPKSLLKKVLASGDYEVKDLFNTSGGEYRRLNMKDEIPRMTRDTAVAALSTNGGLMKRPVLSDGARHTVGFREAVFKSVWG
jgi:arsenate reductase